MDKEYKVHITKIALEHMEDIKQYIAYQLSAPQAAKNLILLMREAILSLKTMPLRNPLVDIEKWNQQGIRRMIVNNFFIYYWINEEKNLVYVTAVIYAKRDQLKQLERISFE